MREKQKEMFKGVMGVGSQRKIFALKNRVGFFFSLFSAAVDTLDYKIIRCDMLYDLC